MRSRHYTIFDKEKTVAALLLVAVLLVIGIAIGSCCKGEEQLATCWAMCKPGSQVIVRRSPDKKSMEVGWLDCGDDFKTDGDSKNGFIRCYGIGENGEGWVYCGYVSTEEPEMVMQRYVCVAKKQVAIRRWMGGPQVERSPWLKNGQNVTVFCIGDGWACTSRGYIKSEWLEVDPE
jgi:hypothetical protein